MESSPMSQSKATQVVIQKRRQKGILRGLRKRFSLFDQRFSDSSLRSVEDERTVQAEFANSMSQLELQLKSERASEITNCDIDLDRSWQEMETKSFLSLSNQEKRLGELLTELRRERESEIKGFGKARSDLQRDYDAVKTHPGKRFEHKKAELEGVVKGNESEFDRCLQLVAARSIAVNFEEPVCEAIEYANIAETYSALKEYRQAILDVYTSLKRQPAAKLVESIGVWLVGLVLALAAFGIAWYLTHNPVVSIGSGIGVAIVGVLGLVIGLRPLLAGMVKRELPKARLAMMKSERAGTIGRKMLEVECQNEQHRLRNEYKEKVAKLEAEHDAKLKRMQERLDQESAKVRSDERSIREVAARKQTETCKGLNQKFKPRYESLIESQNLRKGAAKKSHAEQVSALKRSYRDGLAFMRMRVQQGIESCNQMAKELTDEVKATFPDWNDKQAWSTPKIARRNQRALIPLGTMKVELGSNTPSIENEAPPSLQTELPLLFRLIEEGSLVLEAESLPARDEAQSIARNVLLRALTSLPVGQFQTTVIDPDGLGKDYSWLMHLADADPRLVNYRVWTQTSHISEQLSKLSHHTEDVIQQLLRDRYPDLRSYNRDAGTMAEAYRLLVWSRFPIGLDENSWKSLCSLLTSGGRCGVSMILILDPSVAWPFMADQKRLSEVGLYLKLESSEGDSRVQVSVVDPDLGPFAVRLAELPEEPVQNQLLDRCVEESLQGNRVEVPFDTILPAEEAMGQGKSAEGLAIPLGQSGIGRALQMRLGLGTSQHVVIAGKTGSGKSSLLHTLITSAALKYAPDQLRLILLDFKKGVEFQVYAESHIPHADIIGIESQREFGLSALEYLDRVMQKRGEMFRSAGAQDVASWVRKHPDRPMPRILVVIDEFQELFVEDDKLAQQCSMLLDRVVRQGRSFGIHVILASQTLGGAYSLPRTTLAQMAVRIALQCEGADAMIILGEDNLAAERLRHAGQAIYNDASGRIEGNQPFQVAYVSKAKQMEKLSGIQVPAPFNDESNSGLGRCIVFEGHKAAIWDAKTMESALEKLPIRERTSFASALGDSVSIEPSVAIQWGRQAGRNLLMVGGEERNGVDCLASILSSACWSAKRRLGKEPRIVYLDGGRPDDVHSSKLATWVGQLKSECQLGDVRKAEALVQEVHSQLLARMENGGGTDSSSENQMPILLVIAQLARFRELRKNDDFSFGEESSTLKPDQQLQAILRDGPQHGIHAIVWADNWNTVSRWIPRQSMHDLELRVLMQMSANDSNHLIDSPIANRLDSHVLLLHDEASGHSKKFRPYRMEDLERLSRWIEG